MIAQELHISVILLEIRGGAVGIVFTGFGTLVIKAQKVYMRQEAKLVYMDSASTPLLNTVSYKCFYYPEYVGYQYQQFQMSFGFQSTYF